MKLEEVNTRTKEAVDFLVAALESGHSEVLTAYLGAMAKFHTYSFGNIMLIARQKPDATNVAGLRTWNSLGRFVKRGEKGIFILAPMVGKRSTKDVATDEPTEDATTEGQRMLYGFRAVYVFDVTQTEGKDLPGLTEVNGDVSGYPKLRVRLMGQFPIELVRSVAVGELNFALVTAPLLNADIIAVPFAQASLYAALPENHPAAKNETLELRDLANDEWILFPKRLHPIVYDAIMAAARRDGIRPKCTHDAVTAEQAIHLVSEQVGVGIVTKPNAFDFRPKNVVLKPFSDKSLRFETCVIMRKGDDSRLTNQFVRTLLRKFKLPPQAGGQMELSLSA